MSSLRKIDFWWDSFAHWSGSWVSRTLSKMNRSKQKKQFGHCQILLSTSVGAAFAVVSSLNQSNSKLFWCCISNVARQEAADRCSSWLAIRGVPYNLPTEAYEGLSPQLFGWSLLVVGGDFEAGGQVGWDASVVRTSDPTCSDSSNSSISTSKFVEEFKSMVIEGGGPCTLEGFPTSTPLWTHVVFGACAHILTHAS